jgi:CRISPR system Cascade subunit CasD
MEEYLILRLDAPLQAWGDVAMDPRRPTRAYPSLSGLTGLIASALGWRYRDADRTTALQDLLCFAVREDRRPEVVRDYHTADLGRIGTQGWTRWGIEKRAGSAKEGTQILERFYLAGAVFTVTLGLRQTPAELPGFGKVTLDDLESALRHPARPLFLGRRGCPPATPLLRRSGHARVRAASPAEALLEVPLRDQPRGGGEESPEVRTVRIWHAASDGGSDVLGNLFDADDVWDRRDFRSNRFGGSRRIVLTMVQAHRFPGEFE